MIDLFADRQRAFNRTFRLYLKYAASAEAVIDSFSAMCAVSEIKTTPNPVRIENTVVQVASTRPTIQYRRILTVGKYVSDYLMDDVVSFVVHGSFATADFVSNGSDLDTFVIVRDEVIASKKRLERFRRLFSRAALVCYQIDPLAHHEFVAVSKHDVRHYSQTFFPLQVFNNGALLAGNADIPFALRNEAHDERTLSLKEFRNAFKTKIERGEYSKTAYGWKQDIARALLLPSLALQLRGEFVYKRESFSLAKKRFPHLNWSCVDEASAVRMHWSAKSIIQRIPTSAILAGFPGRRAALALVRTAQNEIPKESKNDIMRLTSNFLALTDSLLQQ